MIQTWKTLRVFISSTFRDMHAERDHLVKVVFPELRERLEKHRIHLVDIDLRWGVTAEQADNDMVLDICLDQIDQCRPFFVGILGQRYGWIPEEIPDLTIRKYGWIQGITGKSVTELEILYGVLNNPAMRNHAMFLFRKNDFLTKVPEAMRENVYIDEYNEKLIDFKRSITEYCRHYGAPLREYICQWDPVRLNPKDDSTGRIIGLEQFGNWVKKDLWEAISKEYPQILKETPPPALESIEDWLAEEQDYHERFVESRTRFYVGRDNIHQNLLEYIHGMIRKPILLTGPPGSGKSAILARLCRESISNKNAGFVIFHFVGASAQSTNIRSTLLRLCLILKQEFDFEADVPRSTEELNHTFQMFLAMVPTGCRIVLIIDAIDQFDEIYQAYELYWLPRKLPENVRIVLSCIDEPEHEHRALQVSRQLNLPILVVKALTNQERWEILERVPSVSAKTLDETQKRKLLTNPATCNPLYLLVALEELRGFGSFEQLNHRTDAFPYEGISAKALEKVSFSKDLMDRGGDAVTAIFMQVIEHLTMDFNPGVVQQILSLLAASRRGLTEKELKELLADLPGNEDMFPILRQLRPYLMLRGELIDFFHRSLYKAVQKEYLQDSETIRATHLLLAGYFEKLKLEPRKVEELPWQLVQTKEWKSLYALLADLPFFQLAWEINEFEVRAYWTLIEGNSSFSKIDAYSPVLEDPERYAEYTILLADFFAEAGHPFEALQLREFVLEFCRDNFDRKELALCLGNLAVSLMAVNELDKAMELLKEQEDICREIGDMRGLSNCLGNQANNRFRKGDINIAIILNEEALRIDRELGHKHGLQTALGNLAICCIQIGDISKALEMLKEQEDICREIGWKTGLLICLGNQANIYHQWGLLDEAKSLHQEEEQICREIGNIAGLGRSLCNQAAIFREQGRLNEALTLHEESVQIFRKLKRLQDLETALAMQEQTLSQIGDSDGVASVSDEKERVHSEFNDINDIMGSLQRHEHILKAWKNMTGSEKASVQEGKQDKPKSFTKFGPVSVAKGDLEKSKGEPDTLLLRRKEEIFRKLGDKKSLQQVLGELAAFKSEQNNLEEALALYTEQEQLCQELADKEALWRVLYNEMNLLFYDLKQPHPALQKCEEVIGILIETGSAPDILEIAKSLCNRIKTNLH